MEPSPRYLASWPKQPTVATEQPGQRASYRPTEIAEMHGISKTAVYEALYRGELKGHRVGRKGRAWVVPVEEIARWLAGEGVQQSG